MFILKNPSKADENTKDKTLGRLVGWTFNWDIHNFTICNLYASIAKEPELLKKSSNKECIGEENNNKIKECLKNHQDIILGFGEYKPLSKDKYDERILEILNFQEIKNKKLYKIGECTKEGYPKHPRWWTYKMEKSLFDIEKFS